MTHTTARFTIRKMPIKQPFYLYDSGQYMNCFDTEDDAIRALQTIAIHGDAIEFVDGAGQITSTRTFVSMKAVMA